MAKTSKIPKTFHWCGAKYHYVTSFEDGGDTLHVVKYFGKHKQWWHYEVWRDVVLQCTLDIIRDRANRKKEAVK